MSYFLVKIKYDKIDDSGLLKLVSETYLVEALTFSECESRIIEEMQPFMSGEFEVVAIKKETIAEIFDTEDLNVKSWFKCKVNFVTLDEEKGVEKLTANVMYVRASDLKDAEKRLVEGLKGTMADYRIAAITETKVFELFYLLNDAI